MDLGPGQLFLISSSSVDDAMCGGGCVLFVLSFNLRGVSVNWVCTVYLYAI